MRELGIEAKMRWRPTSMAYFIAGKLQKWGDPVSLLRFPLLGMIDKIRYGALMFTSTKPTARPALEHISAKGSNVHLATPATKVLTENNRVTGVAFAQIWLISVGLARLLFPAITSYFVHQHFSIWSART